MANADPAPSLRIDERLSLPLSEIAIRTSRSSGPGGQHANVTATRVEAVFDVLASSALGERERALLLERAGPRLTAVAQDERSQARNRRLALERLAARIRDALAEAPARRPTRPTTASRERRLQDKRRAGRRKLERRQPHAEGEDG